MTDTARTIFRPLQWDSQMLGISCGTIDVSPNDRDFESLAERILAEVPPDIELTVVKIPASHHRALEGLMLVGARLIDTELVLVHDGIRRKATDGVETRIMDSYTGEEFTELATTLKHSRFFQDPAIPHAKAAALWKESIRNHCRRRASAIAVGYIDDSPAGMIIALDGDSDRRLFLVGVLQRYHRRGVGTAMLHAIAAHSENTTLRVEALATNSPAVMLYGKTGFHFEALHYVVHIWRNNKSGSRHPYPQTTNGERRLF